MILRTWAARHGVPFAAVLELEQMLGIAGRAVAQGCAGAEVGSESRQQALVRLEAAQKGVMLWRNNVGALRDERGIPVRYGLANESKRQNEQLKSSDLIGWRPVVITPAHVGCKVAQFVAREIKEANWRPTPGNKREAAQLAWLNLVTADGGDACFASDTGTL